MAGTRLGMAVAPGGRELYFSFGSNMSTWRVNKNCPSDLQAEFVGPARLDGHGLQFRGPDWSSWRGAPATVVAEEGKHVWGVLWRISQAHLENLDKSV